MNRRDAVKLCAITTVTVMGLSSAGLAQQKSLKDQLVGTWSIVSTTTKLPDGSPAWGANPKGLYIFTENGYYSSHLVRTDRPKFASKNRATGTSEENKAAVLGNSSNYGTYSVNEANKTFTVKFVGSSYPNLEGTEQTRPFMMSGDNLTITNPSPSVGGSASQLVLRRAK
jgi:hypothetical protein